MSFEESKVPLGIVLSLFSAFFYATYLVFLRRKVDNEDKMDIPLFFGKFLFAKKIQTILILFD